MDDSALVMLSGGLDSATCLYWAKGKFPQVSAITFNYFGRLKNERRAALALDGHRLVHLRVAEIDAALSGIRARGLPLPRIRAADFPLPGLRPLRMSSPRWAATTRSLARVGTIASTGAQATT